MVSDPACGSTHHNNLIRGHFSLRSLPFFFSFFLNYFRLDILIYLLLNIELDEIGFLVTSKLEFGHFHFRTSRGIRLAKYPSI